MKKLLGTALSAAMVLSTMPLHAELLKNLKVDGSLETQAVDANNVTDFNSRHYDEIGDVQSRVMLNVGWDLLDDVHSMVTLRKNDGLYGNGSQSVTMNNAGTNGGVLGNTFVDQAYVKIDKLFGAIDTTVGRQFYGDKGDAVIYFGALDHSYGMGVTAIDAARFDWDSRLVGVTGLVASVNPGAAQAQGAGDQGGTIGLYGLNAKVKGNDMANGNVYIYDRVTHNNGTTAGTFGTTAQPSGTNVPPANEDDYLYVAGLKGKLTAGGAWLKGEFDKNFGQDRTAGVIGGAYTGWEFLTDFGYKADVTNVGGLTGWGSFGVGSGGTKAGSDFQSIAGDYRPGGIYGLFAPTGAGTPATLGGSSNLGTVSSNNLSDRVIYGLGVKVTPAAVQKLTLGVSWWNYSYQALGANNANGTPAAAVGNKHIGDEWDLDAKWQHSDNVSFGAGVGLFQVGGAIENASQTTNPNVGFTAANSKNASSPVFLASANMSIKF